MAEANVFISSTFVDLHDFRQTISQALKDMGYEPILFERGGMSFDPSKPVIESGFDRVRETDVFVLVIGGRYGTSTHSGSKRKYLSVTRAEYRLAANIGMPIFVFVDERVNLESQLHADNRGKNLKYKHTQDTQVFDFLAEIRKEVRNNAIFTYRDSGEIVSQLKMQLAGLVRQRSKDLRRRKRSDYRARVNAYKLFYYRTNAGENGRKGMSIQQLAEVARIPPNTIGRLEKTREAEFYSPDMFGECEIHHVAKLERVLGCPGALKAGQTDDFLTKYLIHYKRFKGQRPTAVHRDQGELQLETRVVVLDFDGTLTVERSAGTTWQRLWHALGYEKEHCEELHRRFWNKEITHPEWCDLTLERFRERGLTEDTLRAVADEIELAPGAEHLINELHKNDIELHLLSGSIEEVIRHRLGKLCDKFTKVQANKMGFGRDGVIKNIDGTYFDFEGKAEYVKDIVKRRRIDPLNALYVGNSCNDEFVSRAGVRTLCINNTDTNKNNLDQWTHHIGTTQTLAEILPYAGVAA